MIDKKQILEELEREFLKIKKEIGFKASLEELEGAFAIKDSVLSNGFVAEDLARQLCSKISETFYNWVNYLNGLMLPNSAFVVNQTESRLFNSKEEREKIWDLIKGCMGIVSKNSLDVLMKDKVLKKEIIDGSLEYWKNNFSRKAEGIMKRVHESWNDD